MAHQNAAERKQCIAQATQRTRDQKASFDALVKKLDAEEAACPARALPFIGMDKTDARITKWGTPDDVRITETAGHVQEQWIFTRYRGNACVSVSSGWRGYLYFTDGVLTTIQR